MLKPLNILAAVSLFALATPTVAQETTNDAEQPVVKSPLDLGEPVSDGPKVGERYSKAKHGDWDLACIKTQAGTDPCSLLQILKDETGNPVAEFSLFRIENGGQAAAGATVLVPLETLLTAQLTLAIDDGPGKRYSYAFCNPLGCAAQIGLTQDDVDSLKAGNSATLSIVPAPAPDQTVNLTMSLKGFTAGFDVVDVLKQ